MPNEAPIPNGNPPAPAPAEGAPKESFIHIEDKKNSSYNELFQQEAGGNIRIGPKAKKPILEILTKGLGYLVVVSLVVVIGFSLDVFLRNQKTNAIAEKYTFLCSYISLGVTDPEEGKCRTVTMIGDYFAEKGSQLRAETMGYLTQYIPIKISRNLIDASPEKAFIMKKYESKVQFDKIIEKFEKVRAEQQYAKESNISCTGISMNESGNMSTQCIVYGGDIGAGIVEGKLSSSRIEALNFIDALGETNKSEFIVIDPPLSLSVEEIPAGSNGDEFTTRTIVPLQLQYVPITPNEL